MRKLILLSMAFLLLAMVPSAFADSYTLQSYNVTLNSSDPGLVVNSAGVAGTPTFNLTLGQSVTFDLFKLWTNETSVDKDDKTAKPITVGFIFNPPASSGSVGGTTDGYSSFLGIIQDGQVTWNGPTFVNFANGGQYEFSLSNATFNKGVFGLDPGYCDGATIEATLKETMAPTPEPASLLLLGSGFVGLAGAIRRRFKA